MSKLLYIGILMGMIFSSCGELSSDLKSKIGMTNRVNTIDTVLYSKTTDIAFLDTMIDLGNVKEGGEYRIVYYYKNIGEFPLMLFNVSPSCGCTIAEFSHNPLSPNEGDSIIAKFDSKAKSGSYQKNIKVNCNTIQKVHDLNFKVHVLP
jgi:hypothetical protein